MDHRFAKDNDLDFLAEWNHLLIKDEGHRNSMTVPQLRERMRGFIAEEYKAVIFTNIGVAVAYALYKENEEEVYLRQLFVTRDKRRQGIGREAVGILRNGIWPRHKRLTVEALTDNTSAIAFWRSVGYKDYCLTLEIMPG
jgi:GNAT superfamily N-acetyltransferase